LIAALGVIAAAATFGAFEFRQFQLDRAAVAAGEAGREALARADYDAALDGLGRYLQRFRTRGVTADDYVLYARARRHVELPNHAHLTQAITALRKAREIDPHWAPANEDLLETYLAAGYATEALEVLDAMLAQARDDRVLLDEKCDVLTHLRRWPEALETARRINRLAPDDLTAYFGTLAVLVASGRPASDVDAWTGDVIAAHAADPRFELLTAALSVERRDLAGANTVLDRLLAVKTAQARDPAFVALLVRQLDAAGRFADSLGVLERLETADAPLRRDLVRRLWYAGRLSDVASRIATADDAADPELVALRALALTALGRRSDAEPLRRELETRADPAGKAWSVFLAYEFDPRSKAPGDAYDSLRAAALAVPGSAFLRHALGDAAAALGESGMAIEAWSAAADRAAAWASPLRAIANVLLATPGREASAVVAARAALTRAPTDAETVAVYIRAVAAAAGDMSPAQRDELIAVVTSVQQQAPAQAAELLPLQIGLIARADTADAERRLRDILGSASPMSEATILQLARVAADAGIPLEANLLDLAATRHGVTPQLAMARAVSRARADGPAAGLRTLDALKSTAPADAPPLDWAVTRATYLDATRLPGAAPAWVALADSNPDDLQVQLRMLASSAAWSDRAAVAQAIERVHAQSGDRGTTWRIARGRWLLSGDGSDEREIPEAARLLAAVCRDEPGNAAAHVLCARAFERLGNLPAAEEELQLAATPGAADPRISLERARMAMKQGHADAARALLDRALAARDLAPDMSESAACLLAAQGDLVRSRAVIEPLLSAGRADRRGVLLLARLCADLGEPQRAVALCERLMSAPDPETVELAADVYESAGRSADARDVLARLDTMELRAGERELVRARHVARWGSTRDAVAAFRAAVVAAPDSDSAWSQLLAFVISRGDAASLEQVLAAPEAAGVAKVRFLISLAELRASAMADPRLRPLLSAAVEDADVRAASIAAIRSTVQNWGDTGRRAEAVRVVVALADANVRLLPLQILAADLCAATGDLRRGTEIARRAMAQFPNSAEGARRTATMLADAGRWEAALEAGLAWRERAAGRDLAADVFVAQILLRLDRGPDAVALLEPRFETALSHPDESESLLLTFCVALSRSGKTARAADVLQGLARRSGRWRLLPLVLEPGQWMSTADDADAWLAICAGNVPADDPALRLALARTWGAAWDRFHSAEMLAAAREILRTLTAAPESAAEVWHEAGLLEHKAGDLDAARTFYDGALRKDPDDAVTHNDMAMLLADAGRWREAVEHATRATIACPSNANYRDTLAHALRKGGEFEKATIALEAACRLEPANPAWRVGLAETLAEAGRPDEADRETDRAERMTAAGAAPSASLRARLERLQSRTR
jgi:tetratricopeptide (TPR) repeat protein